MKNIINFGIVLLACTFLFPLDDARAQDEVRDGPSRSELFNKFVRAPAEAELGVLSSALPLFFHFPLHVREDGIFGIDVSHHNEDSCNCKIDWKVVGDQKIIFAYMKATQGAFYRDPKFDNNWTTLAPHPTILRGAYHFLSSKHDPIDQAKNFLAKIGTLQPTDMPPCLDIEWDIALVDGEHRDAWIDVSPEEIVDRSLKWLNAVETATGRIPVIYTSQAWWKNRVKEDKAALFHRYQIWIADYSEKGLGQENPSVPAGRNWALWQFTEKGVLAQGIPGHVDANIFKGSMDEFRQTFGISPTVPNSNVSGAPKTDPATDANVVVPNNSGTPGSTGAAPDGANAAPGGVNSPNITPPKKTSQDASGGG
jgi:lysozyme